MKERKYYRTYLLATTIIKAFNGVLGIRKSTIEKTHKYQNEAIV